MKIGILPSSPLFCGMTTIEIEDMLSFLSASVRVYADGEYIFKSGEKIGPINGKFISPP